MTATDNLFLYRVTGPIETADGGRCYLEHGDIVELVDDERRDGNVLVQVVEGSIPGLPQVIVPTSLTPITSDEDPQPAVVPTPDPDPITDGERFRVTSKSPSLAGGGYTALQTGDLVVAIEDGPDEDGDIWVEVLGGERDGKTQFIAASHLTSLDNEDEKPVADASDDEYSVDLKVKGNLDDPLKSLITLNVNNVPIDQMDLVLTNLGRPDVRMRFGVEIHRQLNEQESE